MSVIRRAWRYVTRQRVRSLTLMLVLLISSTTLMTVVSVGRATDKTAQTVHGASGAGVTLRVAVLGGASIQTPQGWGKIPSEMIQKISKLPNVKQTFLRQLSAADLVDVKNQKLPDSPDSKSAEHYKKYGNAVAVEGVNYSEAHTGFRTGVLSISSGRHLNENDTHAALIHEDIARDNGLKVGDTLRLRTNAYAAAINRFSTGEVVVKEVTVKIVGLVRGKNFSKVNVQEELFSNTVYTDLATTRELNNILNVPEEKQVYNDAVFFTTADSTAEEFIAAARELRYPWQMFELKSTNNESMAIFATIDGIRSIVRTAAIGAIVISAAALSLVLLLWARERRRETGILLSLGRSKTGVIIQRLVELIFLAIPAFALSYLLANTLAQKFGNYALKSATRSILEELATAGSFGGDLSTAQATRTLSNLTVNVEPQILLFAGGLVGVILMASVLISSIPVLHRTPRELIGAIA